MDSPATKPAGRSAADGSPGGRRLLVRALALAGSLAGGLAVGGAGYMVSGSPYWFLAVPAALAVVWLFVGTPQDCSCSETPHEPGPRA
ncbi:MAG: hypothetical protein HYZ20_10225 [Burkholderiales bacterium]|nr:hypothetical protein [Burkholderiales bacterium]